MTNLPVDTAAISIAPISQRFLERARTRSTDDQGQAVQRMIAKGGEPCRDVLRRAQAGEELILASFTPFTKASPYKEYGPIFILANSSAEIVRRDVLPTAGSPTDYLGEQFAIRAYSEEEAILDAALVRAPDFAESVERFLVLPDTAFLHVRFPTYGCFALRIDRNGA